MELKGSKTEQNLMTAFAGESQARNKYTYYASKARKEGYEQIAALFEETANNEKEHAKLWFKALHDGDVPDTITNLNDAADGENYEWTDMYKDFALTAKVEGFEDILNIQQGKSPILKSYDTILKELSDKLAHVDESLIEILKDRNLINLNVNTSLLMDHLVFNIIKEN